MANSKIGVVIAVGNTQQITSKNGKVYDKRSVFVDATSYNPYTGERSPYENKLLFDFIGEKTKSLDSVKAGDVVEVFFDLQGSSFVGDDGHQKHFVHIRPYDLQVKQAKQQMELTEQQPLQTDMPF